MTRYTYTGDLIPEAVAEARDEIDAAYSALEIALYRADRYVEGAYSDVARAREWLAEAQARLEAAYAVTVA